MKFLQIKIVSRAKKKIQKKYVKAVKAQQLDLLYYQIAEAYGTINPFL